MAKMKMCEVGVLKTGDLFAKGSSVHSEIGLIVAARTSRMVYEDEHGQRQSMDDHFMVWVDAD